jgi:hypothetical protein
LKKSLSTTAFVIIFSDDGGQGGIVQIGGLAVILFEQMSVDAQGDVRLREVKATNQCRNVVGIDRLARVRVA